MITPALFRFFYASIAKPILFRCDPERVHDAISAVGFWLGAHAFFRRVTQILFSYRHPSLEQTILGIHFHNPVGLSAGFDKNAELIPIMHAVGFGFVEVGSITGAPCAGNPKPRLWRLPKSRGLLVWYGLKNDGAAAIARRLHNQTFPLPVGTSVARTNSHATVDTIAGINDYAAAFSALANIGAYTTINISCPNTCGGEPFTDPGRLDRLLTALDTIPSSKPVFVKIPVDATFDELDALVAVIDQHRVHGIIVSNLTKERDRKEIDPADLRGMHPGGISGRPTFEASNRLIAHLYRTTHRRFIIIGSGGIFTAQDAYTKIRNGASLVQLITGLIYQGPQSIGEINRGLVELLKRDGYSSIHDAIGADIAR